MTIYTTSLCVKANALVRLLTVLVLLGAQAASTTTADATAEYDAPTVTAHARTHDPAVAALLSEEITEERIEAFMAEDGLTWIAGQGWGDELDAMFPPDPYAPTRGRQAPRRPRRPGLARQPPHPSRRACRVRASHVQVPRGLGHGA